MSSLKIAKGSSLALRKENGDNVQRVRVELYWDPDKSKSPYKYDFDASAFVTSGDGFGKILSNDYVCYYFQQEILGVQSLGDNREGGSENEPDETLLVDFTRLPAEAERVVTLITLDEAKLRKQSFGDLKSGSVKVFDADTNALLGESDLTSKDATVHSVLFTVFNRNSDGSFSYNVIDQGSDDGLAEWFDKFGVTYED